MLYHAHRCVPTQYKSAIDKSIIHFIKPQLKISVAIRASFEAMAFISATHQRFHKNDAPATDFPIMMRFGDAYVNGGH